MKRQRATRRDMIMAHVAVAIFHLMATPATAFVAPRTSRLTTTDDPSCKVTPLWVAVSTDRRFSSRLCAASDDEEEEDDDEPPEIGDVSTFRPPTTSLGWGRGRSSPQKRSAFGKSGAAHVYLCTNCGSEFVKWMGKCPTCQSWNTLQEHVVGRQTTQGATSSTGRPHFGGSRLRSGGGSSGWVTGADFEQPVRITDLLKEDNNNRNNNDRRRIPIPNDSELNTVLGGGIMKGSLILMGGEPGVGKSTLVLQAAASVASLSTPQAGIGMGSPNDNDSTQQQQPKLGPVWYVSGEENPSQIASRAARMGIDVPELYLHSETHMDTLCDMIVQHIEQAEMSSSSSDDDDSLYIKRPPCLVVLDSIQTMVCESAGPAAAAGGVTQVRECVNLLLRLAKSTNICIWMIGHVTKSGNVAGPRTVEHMVDVVLYLEQGGSGGEVGGGGNNVRLLRASKNRFGSSDEVGLYEMMHDCMLPVSDPASLLLGGASRAEDVQGCATAVTVEGQRCLTVEVQALVVSSSAVGRSGGSGAGKRTVDGLSYSRLVLLLAVLAKRCGMAILARYDVYMNVAGCMQLTSSGGKRDANNNANAADLAVAIAIVSSALEIPVRSDTVFCGEIGLLGELRSVPAITKRLQEARRRGFSRIVTPKSDYFDKKSGNKRKKGVYVKHYEGMEWIQCDTVSEAINAGLVEPMPSPGLLRKRRRKEKQEYLAKIEHDDDDDGEEIANQNFDEAENALTAINNLNDEIRKQAREQPPAAASDEEKPPWKTITPGRLEDLGLDVLAAARRKRLNLRDGVEEVGIIYDNEDDDDEDEDDEDEDLGNRRAFL